MKDNLVFVKLWLVIRPFRTPFVYKMGFIRFSLVVGNDLFEFT
jgi:hypothetical protein